MIAILGGGTAGLTAQREISRKTDDYILIDGGPMGTTCARIGCMPSKALIQVANDFHRRHHFAEQGIHGAESLTIDTKVALSHVRKLRNQFTGGVYRGLKSFEDKIIRHNARFKDAHTLEVNGREIQIKKAVIATGSHPWIPDNWLPFREHLITTDELFELDDLPREIAVIGLGVIGLEMGQALHRLGVKVTGIGRPHNLGGASSPNLLKMIQTHLQSELSLVFADAIPLAITPNNKLRLQVGEQTLEVDKALMAVGRRPNIKGLNLEACGVQFDERGLPSFDSETLALKGAPHLFLAGDANALRPLLHEASDQGYVAGQNALATTPERYQFRTPLAITFCDPNIASAGQNHRALVQSERPFVTGKTLFNNQGRALIKGESHGAIEVYADPATGVLLGAELFCAEAEHMAHLLAWSITQKQTLEQLLQQPYYHPVLEEGLRSALREAAGQMLDKRRVELKKIT